MVVVEPGMRVQQADPRCVILPPTNPLHPGNSDTMTVSTSTKRCHIPHFPHNNVKALKSIYSCAGDKEITHPLDQG
jgi:hypothetical protein